MLNPQAVPFSCKVSRTAEDTKQTTAVSVATVAHPEGLMETLEKLSHTKLQKEELGNHLYPLICELQPLLAGKLTGMILGKDVTQLLKYLTSPADLSEAVDKAVSVLNTPEVLAPEAKCLNHQITSDQSNMKLAAPGLTGMGNFQHKNIPLPSGLSHFQSASLHIKGLHPSITTMHLFDRFDCISRVAPVSSIRMCHDPSSEFQGNDAFVHFMNEDDALRALVELGAELGVDEADIVLETDFS
jgi:hypothetical protein